ncbi:hypothetical protein BpHYR1_009222 [Brachionus plicatilis]|uniref:Uncharacterized protein n=1 Tax=Brachionus plicatilis TaxID=10195 RepID=A0A3M7Q652_BRAPC|nr:hypothetical protein BpHYR1_009222 [Brachionus plicatilis]
MIMQKYGVPCVLCFMTPYFVTIRNYDMKIRQKNFIYIHKKMERQAYVILTQGTEEESKKCCLYSDDLILLFLPNFTCTLSIQILQLFQDEVITKISQVTYNVYGVNCVFKESVFSNLWCKCNFTKSFSRAVPNGRASFSAHMVAI